MENYLRFVDYNSGLLRIAPPNTEILSTQEMSEISGSDNPAVFERENQIIFIAEKDNYEMMDYYILSYTMRHLWQDITDPDYYYPENSTINSEHDFNISPAEIDANAFACIAIALRFNKVTRRTYNTDPIAQELYDKRVDELAEEYGIDIYLIG